MSQISTKDSRESPRSSNQKLSYLSGVASNNENSYKQRANILFNKLSTFKTDLEHQKYQKFSQVFAEIQNVEQKFQKTTADKQEHYEKIYKTISVIEKQLDSQKALYLKVKVNLQNLIDSTTREFENTFEKMNRERENNQTNIEKYIDFKVQSFVLKNKGTWSEFDMLNFEPFKEELTFLKKEVAEFYRLQAKETAKLQKEVADSLDRQKEFLIQEMRREDHEEILQMIESVNLDCRGRIDSMTQKRQQVERNVLHMIENVVDSYMKDSSLHRDAKRGF